MWIMHLGPHNLGLNLDLNLGYDGTLFLKRYSSMVRETISSPFLILLTTSMSSVLPKTV